MAFNDSRDDGCECAYGSEEVEFGNFLCPVHGEEPEPEFDPEKDHCGGCGEVCAECICKQIEAHERLLSGEPP